MGDSLLNVLGNWCRCRWTGLSSFCGEGNDIALEEIEGFEIVDHGSETDYRDRSPLILLSAPKQIDNDIVDTPANLLRFAAEKQQRIKQTPESSRPKDI
ncbi:hypothetical protein R1flu_015882 [Riccia fluitans]|uniref:Uncharacterized protein n=1 Tax=Riccia fluitans TaxID=41844 RepID=A0ABD1YK90_9MARC